MLNKIPNLSCKSKNTNALENLGKGERYGLDPNRETTSKHKTSCNSGESTVEFIPHPCFSFLFFLFFINKINYYLLFSLFIYFLYSCLGSFPLCSNIFLRRLLRIPCSSPPLTSIFGIHLARSRSPKSPHKRVIHDAWLRRIECCG